MVRTSTMSGTILPFSRSPTSSLPAVPVRPEHPKVSVVMPVHGDQPDLEAQLAALAAQSYSGWWEVVIGDNGCSPETMSTIASFADRLPALRVVPARARRGANHARNRAVADSEGELVAICDADDAVEPDWLEALVLSARTAEMVGGSVDVSGLNSAVIQAWRPSPTAEGLPNGGGFLPYVVGCNCALWRDVYLAVGGCDEEVVGGGGGDDVDLSWRVQLAGGRLVYAPDAVVQYRLRPDLPALTRQMMAYGVSMALIYRKYRARGAPRPPLWLSIKTWIRMLQRGPGMLASTEGRGRWLGETAYMVGRIRGGFRHRVLFW